MPVDIILGIQIGDEGKGKITDYLAPHYDIIARFSGGNNAGHSVMFDNKLYKTHIIPSGIFTPSKICVLGNGVVIDPGAMLDEINGLENLGIDCSGLKISANAHLVMPYHLILDNVQEDLRSKENAIGTTRRGIGPCYTDKVGRVGVRLQDALNKELLFNRVKASLGAKEFLLKDHYDLSETNIKNIVELYHNYALQLSQFMVNVNELIWDACKENKNILCEGAQGTLLDVDHGMYPFVTSSNCIAAAACIGAGVNPKEINKIYGVFKAYATRVDTVGAFPTKIDQKSDLHSDLVKKGKEFGTTTGRQRRCGWLDLVALNYAIKLNGVTDLVLTKIDIMNNIDPLLICDSYNKDNNKKYPYETSQLNNARPNYIEVAGFSEDISLITKATDLPASVKEFVAIIEQETETPIVLMGVGQSREQIIPFPKQPEQQNNQQANPYPTHQKMVDAALAMVESFRKDYNKP